MESISNRRKIQAREMITIFQSLRAKIVINQTQLVIFSVITLLWSTIEC